MVRAVAASPMRDATLVDGRTGDEALEPPTTRAWLDRQALDAAAGSSHPFGGDDTAICDDLVDGTSASAPDA